MVKMDENADSEHIQISTYFFRSKKPWREGAKVYHGYQLFKNGKRRPVTIKMIDTYRKKHLRKVTRIAKLRHPNIIETIAVIKREGHMYIVMEQFDPNNMQSFFDRGTYFPKKSYKNFTWTKQLIDVMQYIYYKGFIVENLTPRRVFFFSDGEDIKVSLFAIDENLQENDLLLVGSYRNDYQAPEMLNSSTLTPASNIFTIGTILATLWSCGIHPFGEGVISRMYNIMTNQSRPLLVFFMDATKADEFYDLIRWMLQPDPELRPTIDEVAAHLFFNSQPTASVRGVCEAEDGTLSRNLTDDILAEKLDSPEGVDVDSYINRLQSASKQEMLAIFREIFELSDKAQSEIARSIRNADFSGSTMSLYDVHRIGSIINLSKHLDVVNFSSCSLQPGALRLLKDTLTNNILIDELQVTGNPGLMVSDLCSGFDLCAQIGCRFVYDSQHLSKKDRRKLKNYAKEYQVDGEVTRYKDLSVDETISGAIENVDGEVTRYKDLSVDETMSGATENYTDDPKRLIEQKFEMTLKELGPMENRVKRRKSWFQHEKFEEQPQGSEESDPDGDSLLIDCVKHLMEDLLLQVEDIVANSHDNRSSGHSVNFQEKSSETVCVELERSCRQKSYKTEEITPEGGLIELYGCEIEFPPGAVKKKTRIRISVDYNPDNFPKFATAISPILGCKPSRFRVPVRVKLETWFVAKRGKKICVLIMSKANFRAKWKEIDRVQLDERNVIEYDVPHFCGNIGVVQNENAGEGLYQLTNDVWMHSQTANIISLFCKGKKALEKIKKELKADHTHMISVAQDIRVGVGNTIVIEITCNEPPPPPPGMEIASVDGSDGRLEMDTDMLERNLCQLGFRPRPHPDKMPDSTVYEVVYQVNVFAKDGQHIHRGFPAFLNFYWPLAARNIGRIASVGGQHIDAPNIQAGGDVYVGGRRQNIRHDTNNEMDARKPWQCQIF